jgi:hypothetical protein
MFGRATSVPCARAPLRPAQSSANTLWICWGTAAVLRRPTAGRRARSTTRSGRRACCFARDSPRSSRMNITLAGLAQLTARTICAGSTSRASPTHREPRGTPVEPDSAQRRGWTTEATLRSRRRRSIVCTTGAPSSRRRTFGSPGTAAERRVRRSCTRAERALGRSARRSLGASPARATSRSSPLWRSRALGSRRSPPRATVRQSRRCAPGRSEASRSVSTASACF